MALCLLSTQATWRRGLAACFHWLRLAGLPASGTSKVGRLKVCLSCPQYCTLLDFFGSKWHDNNLTSGRTDEVVMVSCMQTLKGEGGGEALDAGRCCQSCYWMLAKRGVSLRSSMGWEAFQRRKWKGGFDGAISGHPAVRYLGRIESLALTRCR